jgi:hypothetical protein
VVQFREKVFRCPFQYPKVPLEAGAPPPNLLMLPTPLIVDKSLKIIKLIKNAIRLTLITSELLVFSFSNSAVCQWIRLTFLLILIVF